METCPTSNLIISGLGSYGRHPILEFVGKGVPCTINTDDPGVFHSSIIDEYSHVMSAYLSTGTNYEVSLDILDEVRERGLETIAVLAGGRRPVEALQEAMSKLALHA